MASARFDSLAKTNFSLARHFKSIIASSQVNASLWNLQYGPLILKNRCQNLGTGAAKKHSFLSNYWFMIFTNKTICLDTLGASHSTRNLGLNFHQARPILFYSRLSALLPRITWQTAEGSWWSSCPKCRKLFHVEKFNTHLHVEFNSSLIFMRETYMYEFSSRESTQTGRTDPQEIRNDQFSISRKSDPDVFVENRPPSCSFSWMTELGLIHTG